MKTYIFRTETTMTDSNRENWWIDPDAIRQKRFTAETLKDALNQYYDYVSKECFDISENAKRTKQPMYVDTKDGTKQTGYVITASTDFERDYKWVKQYVWLWVEIQDVRNIDFEDVA